MENLYHNYLSDKFESECAELGCAGFGYAHRWYIKMGFAGFNSPENNRNGYTTKKIAEAACLRYQNKGKSK